MQRYTRLVDIHPSIHSPREYAQTIQTVIYVTDVVIHICLGKSVRPGEPEKWPTFGTKEAAAIRRLDAHKGPWKITYHVNDAGKAFQANRPCLE